MSGHLRNQFDLSSLPADIMSTYTSPLSPPEVSNVGVSPFTKRSSNPCHNDETPNEPPSSQTRVPLVSDLQLLSSTKSPLSHYTRSSTSQHATIVPELFNTYDYHKHATKATELATSMAKPTIASPGVLNLRDLRTGVSPLHKPAHNPESIFDVVAPSTAVPSLSLSSVLQSLPRTSAQVHPSSVPLSAVVSHHAELSDSVGRRLTADAVTEGHLRYQVEALNERLAAVRVELEGQRDDARLEAVRQRTRAEAAEQSLYELEAEVGRLQVRYENDVAVTGLDGAVTKAQEELVRELRLRLQRAMAETDGARANARRLQSLYEEEVDAHAKTRREASRVWEHRELELLGAATRAESKASAVEESLLALESQLRASEGRATRAEHEREDSERALARMADEREREKKSILIRLEQREKELLETHQDTDTVRKGAYDHGHRDGFSQGLLEGRREGRAEGERVGEVHGYEKGLREGREEGYKTGYEEGERFGLSKGRREARSEHDNAVECVSMERDELARDVRVLRDVIVQLREEQAGLSKRNEESETEIGNLEVKLREQRELRLADVATVNRLQQFMENLHGNVARLQRERDEAIQALREFRKFPDANFLKPIFQAIHAPIGGGTHIPEPTLPPSAPSSTYLYSSNPDPSAAALRTGSRQGISASQNIIPYPSPSPKSAAHNLKPCSKFALRSEGSVHPLSSHTRSLGPRLDAIRHVFDLSHLHRMHSELSMKEIDPKTGLDGICATVSSPPTASLAANTSDIVSSDNDIYLRSRERSNTCMMVLHNIASALFNAIQLASTVGEPILGTAVGELCLPINGGGAAEGGDKDCDVSPQNVLPSIQAMWRSITHSLDADSVLLSHAAHTRARAVDRLDALLRASRVEGRARIMERYFGEEPDMLRGDGGKFDENQERNIQGNASSTSSTIIPPIYSSESPSPDNILACIRKVPSSRTRPIRSQNMDFADTFVNPENSSAIANEGEGEGSRARLSITSITATTGTDNMATMDTSQHLEKPHVKPALSMTIGKELHTLLQYEEAYLPLLKAKVETTVAQVYAAIRGDVDDFQHSLQMAPVQSAKVKKMPNVFHSVAHTHRNVPLTHIANTFLHTRGSHPSPQTPTNATTHTTANVATTANDINSGRANVGTAPTLASEREPSLLQNHHQRIMDADVNNDPHPATNTASVAMLVPSPSHPRLSTSHSTSTASLPISTTSRASPASSTLSTAPHHRQGQDVILVKDHTHTQMGRELPNTGATAAAARASTSPTADNSREGNKGSSCSSLSFLRPTASSVARSASSHISTSYTTSSPSSSTTNQLLPSKSPRASSFTTSAPGKCVKLRIKTSTVTVASQSASDVDLSPPMFSQITHTYTTTPPTKGTSVAKQAVDTRLRRKHSPTQATSTSSPSEALETYSQRIRTQLPSDPLLKLGQQFLYSADRTADAVLAQGCMSNVPYSSVTATGRPDLPMHCAEVVAHVRAERQFDDAERDFVRRVRCATGLREGDVELPVDDIGMVTIGTGTTTSTATDTGHAHAFVIPSDKEADRIHRYWISHAPLGPDGVPMATHTREREDYRAVMGLDRRDTGTDL